MGLDVLTKSREYKPSGFDIHGQSDDKQRDNEEIMADSKSKSLTIISQERVNCQLPECAVEVIIVFASRTLS